MIFLLFILWQIESRRNHFFLIPYLVVAHKTRREGIEEKIYFFVFPLRFSVFHGFFPFFDELRLLSSILLLFSA